MGGGHGGTNETDKGEDNSERVEAVEEEWKGPRRGLRRVTGLSGGDLYTRITVGREKRRGGDYLCIKPRACRATIPRMIHFAKDRSRRSEMPPFARS